MVWIGIGSVLAMLLAILTFRARTQHARAVRLIQQTPLTTIADLLQVSSTAHADPSTRTHAAVQGRLVARETTRLTAPITGSSCVAYAVRVFYDGGEDEPDTNCIEDSKWVWWAVDDGTGLAQMVRSFNPLKPPQISGYRYPYCPGQEISGNTFKNNTKNNTPHHTLSILPPILPRQEREEPSPLDRVISHYGRERLPFPRRGPHWWSRSLQDLSWEVEILKEFGNELFLLGPWTVRDGCAHFQAVSNSLLWFGSRADALSHEQLSLQRSIRWSVIWLTVAVICAVMFRYFT